MRQLIILLSAGTLFASPAWAQDQGQTSGSADAARESARRESIMNKRKAFENDFNSKVLLKPGEIPSSGSLFSAAKQVALCVSQKGKADAGKLVGGPLSPDPTYGTLVKALGTRKYDRCVTENAVGTPMPLISGALAEALLEADHQPMDDRAKGPDASAISSFAKDPSGRTMDSVSRCLAAYSPGMAYKVLQTEAGSAAETAALNALYKATPECGLNAAPADFSSVEQRISVATGLYFWTHRS